MKLVKYGEPLLETGKVTVNGSKVYVNNEVSLYPVAIVINDSYIGLFDDGVLIEVDGIITVYNDNYVVEGDRIDVEFPFETDITVEDKVASSFEGLAEGSVKFKVWKHGDTIFRESDENTSRVFIRGNATYRGTFNFTGTSGGYDDVNGETISITKGGVDQYSLNGEAYVTIEGNIMLTLEDNSGSLLEVIVE